MSSQRIKQRKVKEKNKPSQIICHTLSHFEFRIGLGSFCTENNVPGPSQFVKVRLE